MTWQKSTHSFKKKTKRVTADQLQKTSTFNKSYFGMRNNLMIPDQDATPPDDDDRLEHCIECNGSGEVIDYDLDGEPEGTRCPDVRAKEKQNATKKMINIHGLVGCSFCKRKSLGLITEPVLETSLRICIMCIQRSSIDDFFRNLKSYDPYIVFLNIDHFYKPLKISLPHGRRH